MPRPPRSTYDRALTLLGFRARSAAELRRKLIQAGAPPDEVDEVIRRLREQRILDDSEFASQYARTKLAGSGASRRRILQDLARKGVARDVAEHAIDEMTQEEGIDPAAIIGRVAKKKWASLRRLDDATRRRRLYAFLARRGFDADEIRSAMAALGTEPEV